MKVFMSLLFCTACLPTLFADQTNWYPSNPMGMILGAGVRDFPSKEEWTLQVNSSPREEVRTLFQKGVQDTVWVRSYDAGGHLVRSVELKGKAKVREILFQSPQDRVKEEREYRDGLLVFTYRYQWRDREVISRSVEGADGKEIYTDHFYYSVQGRLRRVERDGPTGPLGEAAWTYHADGTVSFEWTRDENLGHFYAYTKEQALESLFQGDQLVTRRSASTGPGGQKSETRNDGVSDTLVHTRKDAQGRIVEEWTTLQTEVVSRRTWSYDDQGRVLEETSQSPGQRTRVLSTYDADGLRSVERSRNGQLQSREVWGDGKKLRTEIYVNGDMVLEEFWDDGEKVRERYYQEGQFLRERILKKTEKTP